MPVAETPPAGDITRLLGEYAEGSRGAMDRLVPLVYDQLKYIASRHVKRTSNASLDTTLVVHEAYLKLAGAREPDWKNRSHFFAVASRAMRQLIVDHARRKSAAKRGGGEPDVEFADYLSVQEVRSEELLALDEALTQLAEIDPRLARVVELRYFGGLTVEEVAEILGVTDRTVKRDWRKARAFLHNALK